MPHGAKACTCECTRACCVVLKTSSGICHMYGTAHVNRILTASMCGAALTSDATRDRGLDLTDVPYVQLFLGGEITHVCCSKTQLLIYTDFL